MAKEYKYKIDKSFIDFNGHLAEFGYYYYGVEGLRKLCEDRGCSPEVYKELKIGPITFQTTVSFKKEVRENSIIIVNPKITFKNRIFGSCSNAKGTQSNLFGLLQTKEESAEILEKNKRLFSKEKFEKVFFLQICHFLIYRFRMSMCHFYQKYKHLCGEE